MGEDQGLVKVIFDKKTGQLLGAHMIGAEVTELIQGYVVAMNLETTEEELMQTIFPQWLISLAQVAQYLACGIAKMRGDFGLQAVMARVQRQFRGAVCLA
jgi:hypothetical protein